MFIFFVQSRTKSYRDPHHCTPKYMFVCIYIYINIFYIIYTRACDNHFAVIKEIDFVQYEEEGFIFFFEEPRRKKKKMRTLWKRIRVKNWQCIRPPLMVCTFIILLRQIITIRIRITIHDDCGVITIISPVIYTVPNMYWDLVQ